MKRRAVFSPCARYRYTLWREWIGGTGVAMFVALNPSTATDLEDDPTIRREIAFAQCWGFAALCKVNLFALRATDPNVMLAAEDPVGPDNDAWILDCAREADVIVGAWGVHGTHRGRARQVVDMVGTDRLRMLARDVDGGIEYAVTKFGEPRHPLYLRGDHRPAPWRSPGAPS